MSNVVGKYFDEYQKYKNIYGCKTTTFIQIGAFYEIYGIRDPSSMEVSETDIENIAFLCDLVVRKKSSYGPSNMDLLMAGFRDYTLDRYLIKLQRNGYTVAVISQKGEGSNVERYLSGIYSPGTYFTNDTQKLTNNCMCIWIDKYVSQQTTHLIVGMSVIDVLTGKCIVYEYTCEFLPTPATYDDLDRFLSTYNPSEVIFITSLNESDTKPVMNYIQQHSQTIHSVYLNSDTTNGENKKKAQNSIKQIYQEETIRKFYEVQEYNTFMCDLHNYPIALQSLCYLLNFIEEHNVSLVHCLQRPTSDNHNNRVLLGNHTLQQLNILDVQENAGPYSSVVKFTNKCLTSMGKRRFSRSLLTPISNIILLKESYDVTEYILNNYTSFTYLREKMKNMKDLERLVRQIFLLKLTPSGLYELYQTLIRIKELYETVKQDTYLFSYLSKEIEHDGECLCTTMIESIQDTFVLSKMVIDDSIIDSNIFQKGFSSEVDETERLYTECMDVLEAIRSTFNNIIIGQDKKTKFTEVVKIHETEKSAFSLVATKRRCEILKKSMKDSGEITISYISSYDGREKSFILNPQEMSFITATSANMSIHHPIIELNCKSISKHKNDLDKIVTQTFKNYICSLEKHKHILYDMIQFIGNVDMTQSKAYLANTYSYCKPNICDTQDDGHSYVKAHGLRHCLLEHINEEELYVTNDITLGIQDEESNLTNGILLYGTNAVGKTTLIKALGGAVIMAQAGLYVPCETFSYFPYKEIFTRILNQDNMFKGLSTFMVEMYEFGHILKHKTQNSLILGDELCSGTETDSAVSIFVSGLRELYDERCNYIFATHLHEIIHFDEIREMDTLVMKHMKVAYDKTNNSMIYDRKLRSGPGESLYGLEVCKSLHLPSEFISRAYNIREKYCSSRNLLTFGTSRYNTKKVKNVCEICKSKPGVDIHHLQYQTHADDKGYIHNFHKNHAANLVSICEDCHKHIHTNNIELTKKKTSKGMQLKDTNTTANI